MYEIEHGADDPDHDPKVCPKCLAWRDVQLRHARIIAEILEEAPPPPKVWMVFGYEGVVE